MIDLFSMLWPPASAPAPVPGKDAQWIAYCRVCDGKSNHTDDMTLHASRGGMNNPRALDHCFSCGTETPLRPVSPEEAKRSITACWVHWQTYSPTPYNWHTLSEEQRWKQLSTRTKSKARA